MQWIIVGLGNPGKTYEKTRHNFGWFVVDALAEQQKLVWKNWKGSYVTELKVQQSEMRILKPGTFMNLSGQAVAALIHFYKYSPQELVVVHDELDLMLGMVQLKFGGRAAGHKGVQSVIDHLGTNQFWRLRLGIGCPEQVETDTSAFVLSPFRTEEAALLGQVVDASVHLLVESAENKPKAITIQSL
jgi:PTH1 family peptidyl-tRNA hydrolase